MIIEIPSKKWWKQKLKTEYRKKCANIHSCWNLHPCILLLFSGLVLSVNLICLKTSYVNYAIIILHIHMYNKTQIYTVCFSLIDNHTLWTYKSMQKTYSMFKDHQNTDMQFSSRSELFVEALWRNQWSNGIDFLSKLL